MEKEMKPIYPNAQFKTFCYIKSVITRPNIIAGDYSYYDDSEDGPESFEKHVTHHYDFMGDKLIIGKFVAIARGVEFVMNGANHMLDCLTTYPFEVIDEFKGLSRSFGDRGNRGDTVVGNDVWPSDYTFDIAKSFKMCIWVNWFHFFSHNNMITKNKRTDTFVSILFD